GYRPGRPGCRRDVHRHLPFQPRATTDPVPAELRGVTGEPVPEGNPAKEGVRHGTLRQVCLCWRSGGCVTSPWLSRYLCRVHFYSATSPTDLIPHTPTLSNAHRRATRGHTLPLSARNTRCPELPLLPRCRHSPS